MDYNEFANRIKEKYPQYQNMDNRELAQKMVQKYPQYSNVTFDEIKAQPSNASTKKVYAPATYNDILNNNSLSKEQKAAAIQKRGEAERKKLDRENLGYKAKQYGGAALEIGSTLFPGINLIKGAKAATAVGRVANTVKKSAQQGAVFGLGEGLINNESPATASAKGALVGAGVGAGLQTLPYIVKPVGRITKWTTSKVTGLNPKTIDQALKSTSKALDLNEDTAEQLLMNTTEKLRDNYDDLLSKRGRAVNNAAKKLNTVDKRISANDLKNDIKEAFDRYNGENINPARNMTGNLEQNLYDLIDSGKPVVKVNTEILPEFAGDKNLYNNQIKGLYQQNVQGKNILHPENGEISFFKNGAGKTIYENPQDFEQLSLLPQIDEITQSAKFQYNEPLNKVRKDGIQNFDILRGRADINGNLVDTDIHIGNTKEGKRFYFNKKPDIETSELLPSGNQLPISGNTIIPDNEAYFNSISPIDLQRAKQQIGRMTSWGEETSKNYGKPILQEIYGKFNNRLSDLSPELARANKDYALVKNFQNNEGLNRVLKTGDNLDSASKQLKNYNKTITDGNRARNVQDLENLLVENGYKPFLENINDVNAAQDLLTKMPTGINFLGVNNLLRGGTGLGLRVGRGINRALGGFQGLPEFGSGLQRILTPLTIQGLTMPQQKYEEYGSYGY